MRTIILLIGLQPLAILAQWTEQVSGVTDNLQTIQFIDTSTGYCGGADGLLLKTTDGGESWTAMTVGDGYVYGLYFMDAEQGYVQSGGTVLRTTDGTTFQPVQVITDNIPPNNDTLAYHPVSAGFRFNGPIGVLTCSYTTTPQVGPFITRQWKTHDFGDLWEPLTTTLPGTVFILDDQHWFAASFNLYETFDAGQTWDTSTTNFFGFPPYCRDCFQILDSTGHGLISMAYEMEFARIVSFTDTLEAVHDLRFTEDIDVQPTVTRFLKWDWTTQDMLVLSSLDQGQTLLPDTAVLPGAQDMDFISDHAGWACGDSGKIWKYTDGDAGIINPESINGTFSIAPNPGHGQLHIHVPAGWVPLHATVMDAAGRTVMTAPFKVTMDVSMLDPGSYLLTVSDKAHRRSMQFIKQ